MQLLDLKVWRDIAHLKGQVTAIALLVACGVAVFIMLRSMYGYLRESQQQYYSDYGFAHVFAHAVRAPNALRAQLERIEGVDRVDTRIMRDVIVDLAGLPEPATGRLISLPDRGPPLLNRLHLVSGTLPESGRRDQVVVSAAFAEANQLSLGDTFYAILGGRREQLSVAGTALSPEFIYEVSGVGTVFPDNRRFGAMWMSHAAMAGAFEMEGGFNDVLLTLTPGASEAAVIAQLDDLLTPYGGIGAYGRDEHLSHRFVESEIDETQITASFFPGLFLAITAFLLHTTLVRLVTMEREQIGLLKAFGFDASTIASHYVKLALVPVMLGTLVGSGFGAWLAGRMAGLYADFFQFPRADFVLDTGVVGAAWAIAVVTGLVGALAASRRVIRLAPAIAMAPPAPPRVRHGRLEHMPLWARLSASQRNVIRNVTRTSWRSAATTAGISLALGVLVTLLSMFDAIDVISMLQFDRAYRDDVTVYFDAPRQNDALSELRHLPGVLETEPMRVVAARLSFGHVERRVMLTGMSPDTRLRHIVDMNFDRHRVPATGLLVGRRLGEALGVTPGHYVEVEVTEGERPRARLPVAGLVDEAIGGEVYLDLTELHGLLGEGALVSGARMRIDATQRDALYQRLKQLPGVASVLIKQVLIEGFEATIEESFMIALTTTLLLGGALVAAIVYNQARIALSERARELASLRVLGFTRREVAALLLGEQALLVTSALPWGLLLGWALTWWVMSQFETEVFRLPMVAQATTYLEAVALVAAAALASALLVRRRLDRLDLIAVLKTRE